MKKVIYTFFLISLFAGYSTQAQTVECGCTNCPLFLPDGEADTLFLNVLGVTNDNLGSPFQGVCGINLLFDHQYLGDLVLTLISPSGQEVQLIGPAGFHGNTDGSVWDIDFIPCSQTPMNPFGLNEFDSDIMSGLGFNFTGTYWPAGNPSSGGAALNCIEDFDFGPVNGEWKIFIEDNLPVDAGTFLGFQIDFCDPTGLSDCALNPCGVFIELDGPGFVCEDFEDDLVLDAAGSVGSTFIWDAANGGTFDGTPSGSIVNVLTAGTYFLTVTDPSDEAGSCIETAVWTIPEFGLVPEIDITQVGMLSCDNPEITLQSESNVPNNQAIEVWVKDGDTDNGTPSEDLVVTEPGEYELTVINLFTGCSTSESITIADESNYPTAEIEADGVISCTNTEVTLLGSSDTNGVDYEWEGPDNFTSNDFMPVVLLPGGYNLTVTDPNNGCAQDTMIEIMTDTISPDFTIIAANDLDCTLTDSELSINSNSSFASFEWTGPNNYSNDTDEMPSVEIGGTYILTATAANGCTATDSVEIEQSADVPDISTVVDGVIDCNTTEYSLSGGSTSSNATYLWSGPNNFTATDADAGMVSDTGTYTLTVFAPNGCSVMDQVFINADTTQPTVTIDTPEILGCNRTTTTLTSVASESGLSYEWTGPNNQSYSDESPEIEGPGTYNLIINGANGCQNSYSVEVMTDDTPPMVDVSIDPSDIITCLDQEVDVINTINDPDYTYAWTGPNGYTSDSPAPMIDAEGTYNVIVTAANGCTEQGMVTINADLTMPDIDFTAEEITCTENMATISVSSTTNILEYAWTGVNGYTSSQQSPDNITEGGEYTAVITAENGCTNTISFEVEQSVDIPDGEIIANQGTTLDCNVSEVVLIASSGTPGATFAWTDPMNTPISANQINADMIGTFILTVTAPNGCEVPFEIVIDENTDGPTINSNPDVDLACVGDVALAVGSDENIQAYSWTGPNAFSSTTASPMVGDIGIYNVEVTGENGCTSTATVEVIDRQDPPSIFVDPTQILICGQDQIPVNGSSNELNVSYAWTTLGGNIVGNANAALINVNAQGTYILTVTNLDNGCEESAEVIVEQDNNIPDSEIVAIESNTINCTFSTITLNAEQSDNGAGFSYEWGNNGGTDVSGASSLQPVITAAGTYFITVTNEANECTSIASIIIDDNLEAPMIELSPIDELNCGTTELNIVNIANNPTQNLEYNWQAVQGGNITSAANSENIDVDMPGTYSLSITNPENGCESNQTFEVAQNIDNPVINAGDNLTLNCGVDAITLNGSLTSNETDITIAWASDNGIIISGEDTFNPEVGSASTYTMTVINNENGCSQTSDVTIEPNLDQPIIEFEPATDFSCATASITLDASNSTSGSGINYQWSSDDGNDIFNDDTPNPEIFEPGNYTLTIFNTNNDCESTSAINIGADTTAPSLVLASVEDLSCTTLEVSLGVDSDLTGLDLQWNALTGNILSGETTNSPMVNQAGEYELIVTSIANQCTASATVMVDVDENTPTVAISIPEEITCTQEEIMLDASQSTEGTNISIAWSNDGGNIVSGETGLNPIVNSAGTYTLTLSDNSSGCEVEQTVTVIENKEAPMVMIDNPDIINCFNETITIQALNQGNGTYEYTWETLDGNIIDGANSLNPELDEGGNYVLTATNTVNGCISMLDIDVEKDIENPVVVLDNSANLTCPEPTATVDANGSSVGVDFQYAWTDVDGNELATILQNTFTEPGEYTLEITNSENGCMAESILTVEDLRQLPNVAIEIPETIDCINTSTQLIAVEMNGQNLEYTWLDANNNVLNSNLAESNLVVDQAGTYSLFVIDPSNGCEADYSVTVEVDQDTPTVTVVSANSGEITCQDPVIALTGDLNGLNENEVSFIWSTTNGNFVSGENTLNPLVNIAGDYQLQVTNLSNGCSDMNAVAVTQDDAIPLATLSQPAMLNCDISTTTISIPANSGNTEIVWTLNGNVIPNANTNELEIDTPGEYMVEITNLDNGCNSMDMVNVIQDIVSPDIDAGSDFELQCNILEYQLQAELIGNASYEINWDQGNGNITQGNSTLNPLVTEAGLYTLEVLNTDNGCISTDEVLITVNENIPTDLIFDAQNPQCSDDLGAIMISEVIGGEGPYTYSFDGGISFTNNIDYADLMPGSYQLSALDANGCEVAQEVIINPALDIGVDLMEEIEILVGDSVNLSSNLNNIDPNDISSIQWTPSTGLSCDDCLNPITTSPIDILYTLEVTLDSGCSAMDQIQLRVDRNLNVYVPNAFSPFNLDGSNDEFYLFAKDNAVTNINTFAIYDKWGTQVFFKKDIQPNDSSEGWQGIYKDEEMPVGVYIYYIDLEYRDGFRDILKGNVTLMK